MSARDQSASPFRLGVNYWPARTAMAFWGSFEPEEVRRDFERIADGGLDSVRLFLTWEHFQPSPDHIAPEMVGRLVTTMGLAHAAGLMVMPTLFTGHMSGVNLVPTWALGGSDGDRRFRVISGGAISDQRLRNWYADEVVLRAQTKLARDLALSLAGHPALLAWDLGNENSNCVVPSSRTLGRNWLLRTTDAIRGADGRAQITMGLHMEDLEEDRQLGPAEVAETCDFLTMHGYPGYAAFADGPTDERLLPFLVEVTRWLGGGADVMFSEFGVPTHRDETALDGGAQTVDEAAAAAYLSRALPALQSSGSTGAMMWCYADYHPAIWDRAPLDLAVHERSFGLWRADGTAKPAVSAVRRFAADADDRPLARPVPTQLSGWLDIDRADFYRVPGQLARLYVRWCEAQSRG